MRTDHPDPSERELDNEHDQILAELLAEYVRRCEHDQTPARGDLLARAAELGPNGRRRLRALIGLLAAITTDRPTHEAKEQTHAH